MSANRTDKDQLKNIRETGYRYAAVEPHPVQDISDADKILWLNYIRNESENLANEYTTLLELVMKSTKRIYDLFKEANIITDVAALGEKMDQINPLLLCLKANPFNQLIGEIEALKMDVQIMFALDKSKAMTNILAETSERVNNISQMISGMNEKINKTQALFKEEADVHNQKINVVPPPVVKDNSYSDLRKSNSGLFMPAKVPVESSETKLSNPNSKTPSNKKGKGFCNIL